MKSCWATNTAPSEVSRCGPSSRARPTSGEWDKHCGVEFLDLPAATERRISAYIFHKTNPQIRAPTAERIDGLWQLFERSGFIYPSKMAYIRKIKTGDR